jgi:hypothetical protein
MTEVESTPVHAPVFGNATVAVDVGAAVGGVPLLIVLLLELSDWKLFHPDGGEASA